MRRNCRCFPETEGIIGLRELNIVTFDEAMPPLEPHIHPRAMEICFLYRGQQNYMVHNENYSLKGLDIFLTYPNESHGSGVMPEEKSILYYSIVDLNQPETFLGIAQETAWIAMALSAIPRRHFRGSERVRVLWEECFSAMELPIQMRSVLLKCAAVRLMAEILRCSMTLEQGISSDIQCAVDYICGHTDEWLRVEEMAVIANLSTSRFKQKFRNQVGTSPGEFMVREKLTRAERLICDGYTITQTAHILGFSSSQYFSHVMKKYSGMTPKQFRDSKRQTNAQLIDVQ